MKKLTLLFTSCLFLLAACSPQAAATQLAEPQKLTVMTHDSFSVSEETIKAFEDASHAKVVLLESGDTGATLNKAILTRDAPLADVLYGTDNTFLSRALKADRQGLEESTPKLRLLPPSLRLVDKLGDAAVLLLDLHDQPILPHELHDGSADEIGCHDQER